MVSMRLCLATMEADLLTGKSKKIYKDTASGSLTWFTRSQAAILVLLEVRRQCPQAFEHLEVYVDGGFERGSDILKAIALGATAVGIGRPYLYSLIYGQEGVEHLTQSKSRENFARTEWLLTWACAVLKDELQVSMRLCGITSLDEAMPALVNALDVEYMVTSPQAELTPKISYRASKL